MTIKKALSYLIVTVMTVTGISTAMAYIPPAYPYEAIVDQYIQAWEGKSMEGMKQLIDKDAVLVLHSTGTVKNVLEEYLSIMSMIQAIHVKKIDLIVQDLQGNTLSVYLHYSGNFKDEKPYYGEKFDSDDIETFVLDKSGKIIELHVFDVKSM